MGLPATEITRFGHRASVAPDSGADGSRVPAAFSAPTTCVGGSEGGVGEAAAVGDAAAVGAAASVGAAAKPGEAASLGDGDAEADADGAADVAAAPAP